MILDLERFLAQERPHWQGLEHLLNRLEAGDSLALEEARRLHALYERASADLARLDASPELGPRRDAERPRLADVTNEGGGHPQGEHHEHAERGETADEGPQRGRGTNR